MTSNGWAPGPRSPGLPAVAPLAVGVTEAARMVGVGARSIWSAIASGELRSARIGRRRVIRVDDLREWLALKVAP